MAASVLQHHKSFSVVQFEMSFRSNYINSIGHSNQYNLDEFKQLQFNVYNLPTIY